MGRSFTIVEGTPGVVEQDIAHLLIPGRDRSPDGMGIGATTEQRVATAADFFIGHSLAEGGGIAILTGYKSLDDKRGEVWESPTGQTFRGVPEAWAMQQDLVGRGVPPAHVAVEPNAIDTVTGFVYSQSLLRDERPVGIVAQEQQLERILDVVAERTMHAPYVGIVAPELPDGPIDKDTIAERLASQYIARRLVPGHPLNYELATGRATRVFKLTRRLAGLRKAPELPLQD